MRKPEVVALARLFRLLFDGKTSRESMMVAGLVERAPGFGRLELTDLGRAALKLSGERG